MKQDEKLKAGRAKEHLVSVKKAKRVAVLIETDDSWGRQVVAAMATFAKNNQWRLLIAPRDHQHRLRLPKRWQGDGILVSMRDRSMAEHVRRSGLPAVDVSIMMPNDKWLGRVATDDRERARMAFEHFRHRQFEHFACYAPAIGRYSMERVKAFRKVVEESGFYCDVFSESVASQGWGIDHDHVVAWLSTLARPLAMFAADPYPARQMAEICDTSGIAVPDDVAILSGDNDDLLCSVSSPQLSSIQLACERIGMEAASMLKRMMLGGHIPKRPILIPPLYVYARQSTDVQAIDDAEIAEILRYIADHVQTGVTVHNILKQFPISRRSLEMRFRQVVHRSPAEHIRRIRLELVRNLLLETDLTITEIANRCNFSSSSGLTQQFKQFYNQSPSLMRAQFHH